MKRGIALLAVLVFLSCTAAGYLYIQRIQEPEVQEEHIEQSPLQKKKRSLGKMRKSCISITIRKIKELRNRWNLCRIICWV